MQNEADELKIRIAYLLFRVFAGHKEMCALTEHLVGATFVVVGLRIHAWVFGVVAETTKENHQYCIKSLLL